MVDGRRVLLLAERVVAVDQEREWIVVEDEPQLLELDAPRLSLVGGSRLQAFWVTTGERVVAPTRTGQLPLGVRLRLRWPQLSLANAAEWPLWKIVVVLYATIALLLLLMMTLAFSTAWIVTGTAY
jgi:hypothetical protein